VYHVIGSQRSRPACEEGGTRESRAEDASAGAPQHQVTHSPCALCAVLFRGYVNACPPSTRSQVKFCCCCCDVSFCLLAFTYGTVTVGGKRQGRSQIQGTTSQVVPTRPVFKLPVYRGQPECFDTPTREGSIENSAFLAARAFLIV
jgi:hypothetical protein